MKENAKKSISFSEAEKEAMRSRVKELKAEARLNKNREEGEKAIMDAISAMSEPDKVIARKIHEIVKKAAPKLFPKTWYGMPAYANGEGKVICFFQAASKFGVRYATFGFQPDANLDQGNMWATSFAVNKLTTAEESKILELISKAIN